MSDDAGLQAHPTPWPVRRASPAACAQASRCGHHHVRQRRRTDSGRPRHWEDKTGLAGHGGVWRGLGRAPGARLTMVPRSSAHTLLPHSSYPGPEGRGAGSDASRSTVGGGASPGARSVLAWLAEVERKCHFEWSPAHVKRSPRTLAGRDLDLCSPCCGVTGWG